MHSNTSQEGMQLKTMMRDPGPPTRTAKTGDTAHGDVGEGEGRPELSRTAGGMRTDTAAWENGWP